MRIDLLEWDPGGQTGFCVRSPVPRPKQEIDALLAGLMVK